LTPRLRPPYRMPLPCPACGATGARTLHTYTAAEAAQHFVLRETAPERHDALREHLHALWGGDACTVRQCPACGFAFADPHVAGDERFYTLAYERTGYPQEKWEYHVTEARVRALAAEAERPLSLLEVGAGDGAFVRRLVPAVVPPAGVLCTEYSAYGRERIEGLGVRCVAEDVRALADPHEGPFDVLCLFQVLEHLDGPDAVFAALARLAAPGAHLFVAVPNDRRIAFNEAHGSLPDMPPNHVGRWTRAAFEAVAARHPWRLLEHAVEPPRARDQVLGHATYRYMRQRQRPGTLASRVERVSSRAMRRPLQAAAAGAYALGALGPIARLLRDPSLGDSQWAHFVRTP